MSTIDPSPAQKREDFMLKRMKHRSNKRRLAFNSKRPHLERKNDPSSLIHQSKYNGIASSLDSSKKASVSPPLLFEYCSTLGVVPPLPSESDQNYEAMDVSPIVSILSCEVTQVADPVEHAPSDMPSGSSSSTSIKLKKFFKTLKEAFSFKMKLDRDKKTVYMTLGLFEMMEI